MNFLDPNDKDFFYGDVVRVELFTCRTCKKSNFTVDQMKPEPYLHHSNRGICNPCNSAYSSKNILFKRAEKNPENYMACLACDRIFSRYPAGAPSPNRKVRTACPHCESTSIEDF